MRTRVLTAAAVRSLTLLALLVAGLTAASVPPAGSAVLSDGQVHQPMASANPFVVIVHQQNPLDTTALDVLSKIFLKKVQKWPTGRSITVADQEAGSAVRERFTRIVHRRSTTAVHAYWQQQIFSGREVPPVELDGDAAVIALVRDNPDAVGYIAAGTPLPPGVKALRVES